MVNDADMRHLLRCVELAAAALAAGDEPFGSVLVAADGTVLFEDHNHVAGGDQTRHPEFEIARWAAAHMSPEERRQATVFTSGEHCPMCAAAHGWVGTRTHRLCELVRAALCMARRDGAFPLHQFARCRSGRSFPRPWSTARCRSSRRRYANCSAASIAPPEPVGSGALTLPVPLRFALRELRGGLAGFRIFLACLALGVAAIAAVGSVRAAIEAGLAREAAALLGGDAEIEFTYRFADPDERAWMEAHALAVSEIVDFRSLRRAPRRAERTLVQVKAVDGGYPLYGAVALAGGGSLAAALAVRDGLPGLVAESAPRRPPRPRARRQRHARDPRRSALPDTLAAQPDAAVGGASPSGRG